MAGRKGRKNLNRVGDSYFNEHRVEITVDEKRELENLVRRANRKNKKMSEEWLNKPYTPYGVDTGLTNRDRHAFSRDPNHIESDFIISRRSASLQQFKTRESFEGYVDSLKKVVDPKFIEKATRSYKRNYMAALENVFGDDAKDIKMKVRMMKPDQFREMIERDDIREIGFIYGEEHRDARLEAIRASWNTVKRK